MRKNRLAVILALAVFMNSTFCGNAYAKAKSDADYPSVIDKVLYKKLILHGENQRPVLVNRVTGKVTYILVNNNQWILLGGTWKKQCQLKYKAQVKAEKERKRRDGRREAEEEEQLDMAE